jgi:hypothetical protein
MLSGLIVLFVIGSQWIANRWSKRRMAAAAGAKR